MRAPCSAPRAGRSSCPARATAPEELIVALYDIGEVLQRPSLARLVRIAQTAEQVTEPPEAEYYALSAQLQGSGSITCKIVVTGPGMSH